MAVSLADLGEKAREQAMIKIAIEEARRRRNAARDEPGKAGGNREQVQGPLSRLVAAAPPPCGGAWETRVEPGNVGSDREGAEWPPQPPGGGSSAQGTARQAALAPPCGGAEKEARGAGESFRQTESERMEPLRHPPYRKTAGTAERVASGNKLHAKKVRGCLKDGTPHTFDSVREFDRYQELALMEKAGEIANLRTQVRYELIPAVRKRDGTLERATGYIADFVYEKDGETVVEDAKGYRNPKSAVYRVFALKRKLMLWKYGIEVKET